MRLPTAHWRRLMRQTLREILDSVREVQLIIEKISVAVAAATLRDEAMALSRLMGAFRLS